MSRRCRRSIEPLREPTILPHRNTLFAYNRNLPLRDLSIDSSRMDIKIMQNCVMLRDTAIQYEYLMRGLALISGIKLYNPIITSSRFSGEIESTVH